MGKEVGKEWNSRFIAFIPFLCGLTSELALALTTLCKMESNQELLFQQTKEDILKVLLLELYCCIVRLILCICIYFIGNGKLGLAWESLEAKTAKSVERLHPKLKKK